MGRRRSLAGLLLLAATTVAQGQGNAPLLDRARGAERVVVGTVVGVEPMAVLNDFGDRLIVSRTTVAVEEVLKGAPSPTIVLDIEGGTLGDVTLEVSDLPAVRRGDRAVFFISRSPRGGNVLHERGRGLLRVGPDDIVGALGLPLDTLRRQLTEVQ